MYTCIFDDIVSENVKLLMHLGFFLFKMDIGIAIELERK